MKAHIIAAATAVLFVAGVGTSYGATKKPQPTAATYRDKAPQEAAKALTEIALVQAGKNGSWERIGAGRVYYLGGLKAQGQSVFDAILSGKHEDSDVYRIARVYAEAGEWAKANPCSIGSSPATATMPRRMRKSARITCCKAIARRPNACSIGRSSWRTTIRGSRNMSRALILG